MSDYIDRQAAIGALIRKRQPVNNGDGTITITMLILTRKVMQRGDRMEHEIDRIECAMRHIESSLDVDPWACEIAVNAMRELINRTRWTPVEQELPEDGVMVWVTIKGHDVIRCEDGETLEQAIARISKIRWVTQGYWSEEEHGWNDPSFGCPLMVKPIAWMPMDTPEPYKEGQNECYKRKGLERDITADRQKRRITGDQ